MKKAKSYNWVDLVPEPTNIDVSKLKNLNKCVTVLCDEWQIEKSLAEAEIKSAYADYLNYKNVFDKIETPLTHKELSALHNLKKRMEAGELSDIKIIFKATGLKKPVTIQSQYLINSFVTHINNFPGKSIAFKATGRPKGPEDPALISSVVALKLNKRYKKIIKSVKDRYIYIGVILLAINAIKERFEGMPKGHFIGKDNKLADMTELYDRVKVLFKI